jgi:Rieske Fe-S protein
MAGNHSSDELQEPSRRRFLKVLAASAALPGILPAALEACGSAGVTGDVAAGKVADLQVDTLRALKGEGVRIGRDAGGVYAMTLTCTHAGCDISVDGSVSISGIRCGCHGSRFDATGNAIQGPAVRPLQHLAVSVDAQQNLTIHAGTDVSATTRTAV